VVEALDRPKTALIANIAYSRPDESWQSAFYCRLLLSQTDIKNQFFLVAFPAPLIFSLSDVNVNFAILRKTGIRTFKTKGRLPTLIGQTIDGGTYHRRGYQSSRLGNGTLDDFAFRFSGDTSTVVQAIFFDIFSELPELDRHSFGVALLQGAAGPIAVWGCVTTL